MIAYERWAYAVCAACGYPRINVRHDRGSYVADDAHPFREPAA